ncbi:MAG: hypothetical protein ABII85_01700 [Bacillota bacterium]
MPDKILKNNNDRKLYVQNPKNWVAISELNSIRVSVLKNTNFAKIECSTFNSPMNNQYQLLAIRNFEIKEGKIIYSAYPQDTDSIVQYLREINF